MKKTRRYVIEGLTVDIPLHYDEKSQMYIEDYPSFADEPVWTPEGHPLMFSGEDSCEYAEEATPGGCPDCGSCKYYVRAAEHTWLGICKNEKHIKSNTISESKEVKL